VNTVSCEPILYAGKYILNTMKVEVVIETLHSFIMVGSLKLRVISFSHINADKIKITYSFNGKQKSGELIRIN